MVTVMTIAGFDPSGGAGVLADIKTMAAFGCYGLAVVTSLTTQNTRGVLRSIPQAPDVVGDQISALLDDFEVSAVKTGVLPTPSIIHQVAQALVGVPNAQLVVDPVLRSTSGYPLSERGSIEVLISDLFPRAAVITPNAAEAAQIAGIEVNGLQGMRAAAEAIKQLGAQAVLITGGDLPGAEVVDVLVDSSGEEVFKSERIRSRNTHGTGCALSSAIACLLGGGLSLRKAVPIARQYVAEAIRHAPDLGHGAGPLNHLPPGFNWPD
jgi:hydroxymethylpyrimidine kinase/phosphomethylpyrimidine kinase